MRAGAGLAIGAAAEESEARAAADLARCGASGGRLVLGRGMAFGRRLVSRGRPEVRGRAVISEQRIVIGEQGIVIERRPAACGGRLTVIGRRPAVIGWRLVARGGRLTAIGGRLTAISGRFAAGG